MRETRVFTDQALEAGLDVELEAAKGQHLLKVLRLRDGASLRLFNGDGREFGGRLRRIGGTVRIDVESVLGSEPPSPLELRLLLGVSRGERMDIAIQKAVELGVARISPVFSKRCVVRLSGERLRRREAHWRGVVTAACEQSGRCRLARMDRPAPLDAALGEVCADLRLVLDSHGRTGLHEAGPPRRGVELLVGPEGGLEDAEVRSARERGFVAVRLGPRIMRTETAPLAALAAIQTLWGDFRTAPPAA